MKPSKKKKKTSARAPPPSSAVKAKAASAARGGKEKPKETAKEEAMNWLIEAFASVAVDQIESAFREAGGDAYMAAGILGAHLDDPGEADKVGAGEVKGAAAAAGVNMGSGTNRRRPKRVVAAASGTVSGVIGKDYVGEGRRKAFVCGAGVKGGAHDVEAAEEFLCAMLGGESELGADVVSDVFRQCGCNIKKALDVLLDISTSSNHLNGGNCQNNGKFKRNYSDICHTICSNDPTKNILTSLQFMDKMSESTCPPSEKFHTLLPHIGHGDRESTTIRSPVKQVIQQKVLESLFSTPECPVYEPNFMDWKKVVEKVESFGQGLEFCSSSSSDSQSDVSDGKEDSYQYFRSAPTKHWDTMKTYYHKAAAAYSRGERAHASYLSEKGRYFRDLAREADEKASREIFEVKNKEIKNTITIDLHGQHVKQAMGLVKLHLVLFTYVPSVRFLKVITGCGSEGVGMGKLKRSVRNLIEKEGIKWSEENPGTLVLRIDGPKEYSFMESNSDSE